MVSLHRVTLHVIDAAATPRGRRSKCRAAPGCLRGRRTLTPAELSRTSAGVDSWFSIGFSSDRRGRGIRRSRRVDSKELGRLRLLRIRSIRSNAAVEERNWNGGPSRPAAYDIDSDSRDALQVTHRTR